MNNKLKSAFISSFIAVATIFSLYGFYLVSQGFLAGFGLVIAHGVWVVFFLKQMLRPVPRIKPSAVAASVVERIDTLVRSGQSRFESSNLGAEGFDGGRSDPIVAPANRLGLGHNQRDRRAR